MNQTDLVTILGNLGRSLRPLQTLISGFGYLLGILFMITAIMKLKKIGESAGGGSKEHIFVPIAFFLGGAALIFLPSAIDALSNTAFGTSSVLQYSTYNPYNIYSAMQTLIKTAGLIWFVRGCVLLVHGTDGGEKEGAKGLLFLVAGVFAMNFQDTFAMVNYISSQLLDLTNSSHTGKAA